MAGRLSRRVVVTGYGVISPCGLGKDAFWDGLLGPNLTGGPQARITWDPLPHFENAKEARRSDPNCQFALAAAAEAFAMVGDIGVDPARFGVLIGTGVGGLQSMEEQVEVRLTKGERRVSPFTVPMMMPNAAGAAISMRYGLRGPCQTVTTACAASTHAIADAFRLIAYGRCDAVVTGGTEAAGSPTAVAGFMNMTAMSSSGASMPFSAERDGFVLGEGSGVIILESLDNALARGAKIYAEVLGGASNADAYHITAPAPGGVGAIACMQLALEEAGLTTSDIRQINAHGTSTPLNDAAEAAAITHLFGTPGPPVTSTKGVHGHALGAAGALEAVATILSMEKRLIPPTAGTTVLDPTMSIDLVMGAPRRWEPGPAMSTSLGFGGHNGAIILGPPPA
jgi:3-oxoacyl-[acyl-carrier-protein] synthase II